MLAVARIASHRERNAERLLPGTGASTPASAAPRGIDRASRVRPVVATVERFARTDIAMREDAFDQLVELHAGHERAFALDLRHRNLRRR